MKYDEVTAGLRETPRTWLITGAAGFIGSNLVETLLGLDQKVIGLDNFSTGYRHNLDLVRDAVSPGQWERFSFVEGDIRDADTCREACGGVDYVLHQAALGSVPRSVDDPLETNANNIDGFLKMLVAARDAGVKQFVYAASSATYGDEPTLPKREDRIGHQLSPYAVTKYVNELYADVFRRCYDFPATGLRYFNVFGKRQDPAGAYAAVIPRWFDALLHGRPVRINGDGETSRDFCHVDNAVQANILAACAADPAARGVVCNVAVGDRTTLNELFALIRSEAARHNPAAAGAEPEYGPFRVGDVRHSLADISRARDLLGYEPQVRVAEGLRRSADWYAAHPSGADA